MLVGKTLKVVLSEEEALWLLEAMQQAVEKMKDNPDYDRERATLERVIILLETHLKVAGAIERKETTSGD